MIPPRAVRRLIPLIGWLTLAASNDAVWAQIPPGRCEEPASQRAGAIGCYVTATATPGILAEGPVFWHLDQYARASRVCCRCAISSATSSVRKRDSPRLPLRALHEIAPHAASVRQT